MSHTLAALRRWGVTDKELPTVDQIKHIHVYDFDNTLFASPLPNSQLWHGSTIGQLQSQETFVNGGWWHDSSILACTGEGLEKEEPKAWEGWWNEHIVNLVQLTMEQKDAVNVLLTGRSERGFAELVQRIVKSKQLDFDLVCLRPEAGPSNQKFPSTAKFKQVFLEDLVRTYRGANEVRIYEDRPKHVTMFRDFFKTLNQNLMGDASLDSRKPVHAEVIEVTENATNLDPVTEVAEVQRMINAHNTAYRSGTLRRGSKPWQIKRTVLYTGYLVSPTDTQRLLSAANLSSTHTPDNDIRTFANNILITPRPCPPAILDRVGGLGKKMRWRVTAIGVFDDKVWAARVEPVSSKERYYCETQVPSIVLAVRRNSRPHDAARIQNWQALPESNVFEFDTVVGEKILLRLEEERSIANYSHPSHSAEDNRGFKRSRPLDEDFPPLGPSQPNASNRHNPGIQPPDQQNRQYGADENHRSSGAGQGYGRGGPQHAMQRGRGNSQFHGRGNGRGGGGGGGASRGSHQRGGANGPGSGRGRGRGGHGVPYRSLDDDAGHQGGRRRDFGTDGAADSGGLTY